MPLHVHKRVAVQVDIILVKDAPVESDSRRTGESAQLSSLPAVVLPVSLHSARPTRCLLSQLGRTMATRARRAGVFVPDATQDAT